MQKPATSKNARGFCFVLPIACSVACLVAHAALGGKATRREHVSRGTYSPSVYMPARSAATKHVARWRSKP